MEKRQSKQAQTVEGELLPAVPAYRQIKLATVKDCRMEMSRVYRDSRHGLISPQEGTRLVYMLTNIANAIKDSELERRVEQLEKFADENGKSDPTY